MQTVEEYISQYNPEYQHIMYELRQIILSSAPQIQESIKFNWPFYTYKGLLCCFGVKIKKKEKYVDFLFCNGYELSNEQGLLQGEGRNTVKSIPIYFLTDINETAFREIIQEAMLVNELKAEKRKAKKKK